MKKFYKLLLFIFIFNIFLMLISCGSKKDNVDTTTSIESTTSIDTTTSVESTTSTTTETSTSLPTYNINISSADETMGKVEPLSSNKAKLNDVITIVATPNKGYSFVNWYDKNNHKVVSTNPTYTFSVVSDVNYEASFYENGKAYYKINCYLQNLNNDEYTIDETYGNSGREAAGKTVTINPSNITGFTTPSSISKDISKDGTTTFDFYYDRKTFDISLSSNLNNDKVTITGAGTYKYFKEVTISASVKDSKYNFVGWYDTVNDIYLSYNPSTTITVNSSKSYQAIFEEVEYGSYTVKCYLQNNTDGNYVYNENLSYTDEAPAGKTLTLKAQEVTGFKTPNDITNLITGDGTCEFLFYYDRLSYNVELSSNINNPLLNVNGVGTYKYEKEVTISASSTSSDYVFDYWYDQIKEEIILYD